LLLTPLVFSYAIEITAKIRSLLGLSESSLSAEPQLEQ
jgi:hypothetical protein